MTTELIAIAISIFTFLGGITAWYSAAVKKSYAAQRDYEHLKRNYEQIAANQNNLLREFDQRFDQTILELKELKAQLNVLTVKLLPETSQGTAWFRQPPER